MKQTEIALLILGIALFASAQLEAQPTVQDGTLSLLNTVATSTGAASAPTDPALTPGSTLLYVRVGGLGLVEGFRIEDDGSLTPVSSAGGVPAGSQGLAVR